MRLDALRRYDVQAKCALVLSLLSIAPCLAAGALLLRNYNGELGQIVYGTGGMFVMLFVPLTGLSIVPSLLAAVLGLSSAGQRRNDKQRQSWIGFFVGGAVASLDLIYLIAFVMLRLPQTT